MHITIFYFSGTGNTEWVSKKTQELLIKNNHLADIFKIEKLNDDSLILNAIKSSDYIGFAYPLYGADIPRIMRNFINRFIDLSNTAEKENAKLFFINTFGYVNGCGIFRARKLLAKCKYPIHSYFNFRLVNNTSPNADGSLLGKNMPDDFKNKAINRIDKLIKSLESGKTTIQGIGSHLLMGMLIRRILRDEVRKNYKNMSVNYSSCIKCMKCLKSCPTESIHFSDDKFTFTDTCETCWRCFRLCPTSSISMNKNN
ncbi:MAG: EFR1 family ferrodoxin [Eubacteriales bacterium]